MADCGDRRSPVAPPKAAGSRDRGQQQQQTQQTPEERGEDTATGSAAEDEAEAEAGKEGAATRGGRPYGCRPEAAC